MPKKFQSENTKAVTAKARKAEKAAEEKAKKDKAAEDALWKEDDKLICKKIQRKEDKERKKEAELQKKKELKAMEEEEMKSISPRTTAPPKVTVFQLQKQKEDQEKLANQNKKNDENITDIPIEENVNRMEPEIISGSGIDAAVAALSLDTETANGGPPGKRMAAAFKAFENEKMPQLKKENPTMRLSQLQQRLRKEWQRSPQNPLNQRIE